MFLSAKRTFPASNRTGVSGGGGRENSRRILLEHIRNPRDEKAPAKPVDEDVLPPFFLVLLAWPDPPEPASRGIIMVAVVPAAAAGVSVDGVGPFGRVRRGRCSCGGDLAYGSCGSRSRDGGSSCAGHGGEALCDGHGGGRAGGDGDVGRRLGGRRVRLLDLSDERVG